MSKARFSVAKLILLGWLFWLHLAFFRPNLSASKRPLPTTILSDAVNHTNPLDVMSNLFYGPWRADIPKEVRAGEEFQISFYCNYPDEELCPSIYTVLFHGPSRNTIPPEKFGLLEWSHTFPDYATVRVTWKLHDPGLYNVYAYPEFQHCSQWNKMDYPWSKAAVSDTPFQLRVTSDNTHSLSETEGYGTCMFTEDIRHGRYLSTNDSVSSKKFTDMFRNVSNRSFSWAPYRCKIPPRSPEAALIELPSAKHVVWVGDSTQRGQFCRTLWKGLWGDPLNTLCDTLKSHGDKHVWKIIKDPGTGEERNISMSLVFVGHHLLDVFPTIQALASPPTHVIFNMGYWVAWHSVDEYKNLFSTFLDFMSQFPQVQHIVLRTSFTVVMQVTGCISEEIHWLYPGSGPAPFDTIEKRLGGSIKRDAIFEAVRAWKQLHRDNIPFRISVVDAFQLTGDRLEATADGAHYVNEEEEREDNRNWSEWKAFSDTRKPYHRIGVGEPDDCVLEWIWDDFINGRTT